jgi:hypothetical protein
VKVKFVKLNNRLDGGASKSKFAMLSSLEPWSPPSKWIASEHHFANQLDWTVQLKSTASKTLNKMWCRQAQPRGILSIPCMEEHALG